MSARTPTPWFLDRRDGRDSNAIEILAILDGECFCIAQVITEGSSELAADDRANAEFIVRACNAYDDALGVLRKVMKEHEDDAENLPGDPGCIECTAGTVPNSHNTGLCAYHGARDLIRRVEGK